MAYPQLEAGYYIIRSALNEDLVLLTAGGSKSKGAKISTGALTESDNRCYWKVVKVGNYNRFSNTQAGTTNGNVMVASVVNNKEVTQNAYKQATGAWLIVESGHTMTINGSTVDTFRIQPSTSDTYYITVPDNGGDLYITQLLDDKPENQEFYFEPTTFVNLKLATPNTLRTEEDHTYVLASGSTSFYPQWKSSKSEIVYEMRYRSRLYDMQGNLAADWSPWAGWTQITATPQKNSKKKYTGIMRSDTAITTPAVDNVNYSQAEIQVQVRLTSAKKASNYNTNGITHGAVVSQIINQWKNPTLTFINDGQAKALYSPDGLGLTYATDYTIAGSSIRLNSIKVNGSDGAVLIEDYTFTGQDYIGDLYLNCDELYSVPNAGDVITVNATIIEENGIAQTTIEQTLTIVFDESWGLSIDPTYIFSDRLTCFAVIPEYSTLELYMEKPQLNGTSLWVPCDKIANITVDQDGAEIYGFPVGTILAIFEFAPPYGKAPNLMWLAIDEQANWTSTIVAPSGLVVDSKFYSWFWTDENGLPHAAILKYQINKIMQPSDEITLAANKFITTGREYPVFRYSKSIERTLNIEGIILNDEANEYSVREAFESMAIANHCIYRQPDGKWYQVAITGIKFKREEGYTSVTIEQEAETR